jgi:hypothetical protein
MPRSHHLSVDLENVLLTWGPAQFRSLPCASFQSWIDAKLTLLRAYRNGAKVLVFGDCDNQDPKRGCLGHDE